MSTYRLAWGRRNYVGRMTHSDKYVFIKKSNLNLPSFSIATSNILWNLSKFIRLYGNRKNSVQRTGGTSLEWFLASTETHGPTCSTLGRFLNWSFLRRFWSLCMICRFVIYTIDDPIIWLKIFFSTSAWASTSMDMIRQTFYKHQKMRTKILHLFILISSKNHVRNAS